MTIESEVTTIIRTILKHQGLADPGIELTTQLYDDGIGLDSLCVAELSAMLEKKYGKDPYTGGKKAPQTVGDIVDFYTGA
jgi:acyl carrier protein